MAMVPAPWQRKQGAQVSGKAPVTASETWSLESSPAWASCPCCTATPTPSPLASLPSRGWRGQALRPVGTQRLHSPAPAP